VTAGRNCWRDSSNINSGVVLTLSSCASSYIAKLRLLKPLLLLLSQSYGLQSLSIRIRILTAQFCKLKRCHFNVSANPQCHCHRVDGTIFQKSYCSVEVAAG